MLILKNLGNGNWLQRSRTLALVIKPELDSLVMDNLLYIRTHNVPLLYESGTVYREEPHDHFHELGSGERVEEFAHISVILKRLWADCDDAGPARVAELLKNGEKAEIRVQWKLLPSGKLFHVLLRRPPGAVRAIDPRYQFVDDGSRVMWGEVISDPRVFDLRGDGSVIEDPSRALGMNQPGGIPVVGPRARVGYGLRTAGVRKNPLIDILGEL